MPTFTALTAANGEIDTTDQLQAVEAYQKCFIVNGTKRKVIDFINDKLTTAAVGTNPPDKGNILTGGTSGAKMIVDYITTLTGACSIYGYVTTTADFSNGETVTGTDDDGNAISFVLSAAPTAQPHWYNWTPYGGSSTYGAVPDKLYLIALYRGRVVTSGNPEDPYQWYMTRQANPFDWAYAANDAQSPVAGANADAGKCGDIIRALIPYNHDYFFFGCANSIWYMQGDPAAGGSLNILDSKIGVFGANSWCFDGQDSLWFWGTDGISRIPVSPAGIGTVENKTITRIPNLLSEAGADPTTHRIVLGYDKRRNGVVISVTKLSNGSNQCYWFDPKTDGFFPEEYPNACGAYSMLYYNANDPDSSDLLVGCTDGYVRHWDDTAADDDIGATDNPIDSYVLLGPASLGENDDEKGKILSTTIITDIDSDGVDYEIHTNTNAEALIDAVVAEDTPVTSGSLDGGKSNIIRDRASGVFGGVKLRNNTASESWSLEKVLINTKPSGSRKDG